MIDKAIKKLVTYGLDTGLISEEDRYYAVNQILDVLWMDEYEEPQGEMGDIDLEEVLAELLDYAFETGIIPENSITYRDLFDTKLMNCLMPRPSEVETRFWGLYNHQSPQAATEYYYKLSQDSDYIRRYRIKKDMRWVTASKYGDLDITINLSKPEKDPKQLRLQSLQNKAVIQMSALHGK